MRELIPAQSKTVSLVSVCFDLLCYALAIKPEVSMVPKMTYEQKKTLISNVAQLCFFSACFGFVVGCVFVAVFSNA